MNTRLATLQHSRHLYQFAVYNDLQGRHCQRNRTFLVVHRTTELEDSGSQSVENICIPRRVFKFGNMQYLVGVITGGLVV